MYFRDGTVGWYVDNKECRDFILERLPTRQDELYHFWKAKEFESTAWDIFESLTEGNIATLSDMEETIRSLPFSGQQRFFVQLALLYSLVVMPPIYTKVSDNLKQGKSVMFLNHDCYLQR